jgi:citrate synthase
LLDVLVVYSGLVYRAMGFPPQFFTVLFAIPQWVHSASSQFIVA